MLHRSQTLCARLALIIAWLLVGTGLPAPMFPDAYAAEVIRPQKRRAVGQQRAQRRRSPRATARSRRGRAVRSRGRNARMRGTRGRSYRSRSYRNRRGRVIRGRSGRAYGSRAYRGRARTRRYARRRMTTTYGAPAAAIPYRPPRSLVIPEARTREIQEKLKEAGFYQGEITGQYDESTREAMRNFQRANGLKETGTPTAPALLRLGLTKHTSEAGDTSAPPVQLPPPTDQPPPQ